MSTILEKNTNRTNQSNLQQDSVLSLWHKVAGTLKIRGNAVDIQKKIRGDWDKRLNKQVALGSKRHARGN